MSNVLYVRKLASLNPDKFDYIKLEDAINRHYEYTHTHGGTKTMKEWLETEI